VAWISERNGGRGRLAEFASLVARRGDFLSWWRGMGSLAEGVGRCGWLWVLAAVAWGGRFAGGEALGAW